MAKPQTYCLVEVPHALVLPSEIAMELFPLLCAGEPVQYDWSEKVHRRVATERDGASIKQFTIAQYAMLALNDEPK